MKRKLLRWLIYGFSALILLAITAILLIDTIAKTMAESRIRDETGMETKIERFTIGLRSPTIHIENFVLTNPASFGGDTFLEMPELYLEYDRDALSAGKLRLKVVRISIAKVHVVENKAGKKNVDDLEKHHAQRKSRKRNKTETEFSFDGIDSLDVTLNSVRFTSERHPEQNLEQTLGITHEMFRNLKTDLDFQTAGWVLIFKSGLSGGLNLNAFFKSSNAGQESKKILEDIAEPLKLDPTKP